MTNNMIDAFKVIIPDQGKKFILERVEKIIESNNSWTDDYNVREFEQTFCNFVSAKYGIAVNSGISAIQAVLFSLGIDYSDAIAYVPTLTAPPTVLACLYSGIRVVYVDSKKEDLGIDVEDLKSKIKKYHNGKGVIIPVHISGIISKNIDEVIKIGREYNLPVIEDCAHAHGATYNNIFAGMRGDAGVFSFFMTKVLMSGEGGIIITEKDKIYEKCKIIRNYGKVDGVYQYKGSNWRMSEFNAVTALWQTFDAQRILAERRKIAKKYDELLNNNQNLKSLYIDPTVRSSYYKYVVFLSEHINRNLLKDILKNEYNMTLSGEVYERPCHAEPVFRDIDYILNKSDSFLQSDDIANSHICLPIYPGLSNETIEYIVHSLNQVINKM